MFNVFTLLLDDAFKSATPLTNGIINETLQKFAPLSDISESSIETHFMCGGIFSDVIIANFPLILTVKQFWQEGLAVASIARDEPSPLPSMHRDQMRLHALRLTVHAGAL